MTNNRKIQRSASRYQESFLITELRRQIKATRQTESLFLDTQVDTLTADAQTEFKVLLDQFEIFLKEILQKDLDRLDHEITNDRFIAFTKELAQSNPNPEIFHLFIRFATEVFKDLEWEVFY